RGGGVGGGGVEALEPPPVREEGVAVDEPGADPEAGGRLQSQGGVDVIGLEPGRRAHGAAGEGLRVLPAGAEAEGGVGAHPELQGGGERLDGEGLEGEGEGLVLVPGGAGADSRRLALGVAGRERAGAGPGGGLLFYERP